MPQQERRGRRHWGEGRLLSRPPCRPEPLRCPSSTLDVRPAGPPGGFQSWYHPLRLPWVRFLTIKWTQSHHKMGSQDLQEVSPQSTEQRKHRTGTPATPGKDAGAVGSPEAGHTQGLQAPGQGNAHMAGLSCEGTSSHRDSPSQESSPASPTLPAPLIRCPHPRMPCPGSLPIHPKDARPNRYSILPGLPCLGPRPHRGLPWGLRGSAPPHWGPPTTLDHNGLNV